MIRELTCVSCPLGCQLKATIENGVVVNVEGNTCPRGKKYAETECTHPVRSLTSTAKVIGGTGYVVPVKSADAIPKELLFKAMEEINKASVNAPVKIGDVVINNVCGTGVSIVATNEIPKA
jgi:CxxC motif-containing protein